MKEKLISIFGTFGAVLFFVFFIVLWAINLMPMSILDFPLWIYIVVGALLGVFPLLNIPFYGIWIWAFIRSINLPINWYTVIFFIAFAAKTIQEIYLVVSFFSSIKEQK